jgi:hypothetical protein
MRTVPCLSVTNCHGVSFRSPVLARFAIEHGNLLKTRMEITAQNLHHGSFPPSLGPLQNQTYSALAKSSRCYEIKQRFSPAGSAVSRVLLLSD